jgi:diaminohydroxyphosphoribosylaminopyrimidine deaminase/5-amino-6-(5-phosphoribosylamino)uracil reductase
VAKTALTLDGWSATSSGDSKWITNEKSRLFVHRLRDRVDGILVGIGTVIADDPSLTTRIKDRRGKDPIRIIIDTKIKIPHNAKVLNQASDSMTLLVVGDNISHGLINEIENWVSTITCPIKDGLIDLEALMPILGKMSITSLMVEGGASLMGSMISKKLIDKFYIFKAPRILGGDDGFPMARGTGPQRMDKTLKLKDIKVRRFGDDVLIRGYPDY